MFNAKRTILAACAALSLVSGAAAASGDITVVNQSPEYLSPYVKTNCWAAGFQTAGPDEWVYFGSLWPYGQFTWPEFYVLLDPKCKNPVVKYTFVVTGTAAPVSADPDLTQLMHYDATENYTIVVGTKIVITGRP
jgi:hypothetical protein